VNAATLLAAPPPLSDAELNAIADLVYRRSGITLHDGKRALITARLQKRLKAGGFRSFSAYLRFVESDASGQELVALLDAIATNHTSFFREPQHFAFLRERIVPEWQAAAGERRPFEIWSAACSTGEEPYSLIITLMEALPAADHGRIRVLASDLSTKALSVARAGVYRLDRVQEIPQPLLRKHFERGLGEQEGLARVREQVRAKVTFEQRNLLEEPPSGSFDVVFCRNVMIYFDRAVQQRVVSMLERRIVPGGYLCISHSEGLSGVSHGLQWVAPAVYRRRFTS
jgi:chemotaxis protein methyltransferase CheR